MTFHAASIPQGRNEEFLTSTEVFGAKIAVLCGDLMVTYLRDDFVGIPNPGQWDLPGGVREPGETALDCALRETREEFAIDVPRQAILHAERYYKFQPHLTDAVFLVAQVPQALIDAIVFGDEGQCWEMMPVRRFLDHKNAVAELQAALGHWWDPIG